MIVYIAHVLPMECTATQSLNPIPQIPAFTGVGMEQMEKPEHPKSHIDLPCLPLCLELKDSVFVQASFPLRTCDPYYTVNQIKNSLELPHGEWCPAETDFQTAFTSSSFFHNRVLLGSTREHLPGSGHGGCRG